MALPEPVLVIWKTVATTKTPFHLDGKEKFTSNS